VIWPFCIDVKLFPSFLMGGKVRLQLLYGEFINGGPMLAPKPCPCILWLKGSYLPGVQPPSGGPYFGTIVGARHRPISKWFVPGGVKKAGVFGSPQARREKRASLSWISVWLLPGGRRRAAEKKPRHQIA
jgi:hypothetical protein